MLTVEDGTGISNADSYQSLATFQAYCASRGYGHSKYTDEECEIALRVGAVYLDQYGRFRGIKKTGTQALEFPRTDLTDDSGYEITGVPLRVKQAQAELAWRHLTGTVLFKDEKRGGMVKTETVGPISTTYMDGAPAGTKFTVVDRLLWQFLYDPSRAEIGVFNGSADADAIFEVGMMDNDQPS